MVLISTYLAGAFGNHMNIDNAMAIGLLPRVDKKKFIRFGNGLWQGHGYAAFKRTEGECRMLKRLYRAQKT